MAIASDLFQK